MDLHYHKCTLESNSNGFLVTRRAKRFVILLTWNFYRTLECTLYFLQRKGYPPLLSNRVRDKNPFVQDLLYILFRVRSL